MAEQVADYSPDLPQVWRGEPADMADQVADLILQTCPRCGGKSLQTWLSSGFGHQTQWPDIFISQELSV